MRVLHWFPNYFHGGGVANAVTGLAHAQADRGSVVAIAGISDNTQPLYGEQPTHPRVDLLRWQAITKVGMGGLTLRPPSAAARTLLRDWKPDVVHVHAEFAPDNLWVIGLFKCPIVLSFHGALHPEVFRKGKTASKQLYVAVARLALYRRVARFIALCPAEAEDIDRVLPGRPVDTIPLGPGKSVAALAQKGSTQDLPVLEGRGVRVVSVGRLDVYTKGLDVLVAAFGKAKACLGARLESLTIVGPDWLDGRRALEAQVRSAGLTESVSFAGGVPLAEVSGFLADADVYAQLSRHDAFPLSVVDALVSGLAAILSSAIGTTSYSEVVHMPNVRITPPEVDAAASALEELVRYLGDGAVGRAEAAATARDLFSWDRIADAHVTAYRAAAS